ncbi:nucleotidyltransferase [filamentous cyanobacterium CCP1]|nr:nucleotidyltransferase [filamentous cyanobacterium CCP2]PSB61411.1 nucleotidyltransferase [filamentous cyanobacterium CCP1]
MKRAEVLNLVQAHQAQLQQLGVKSLNLFGSVARDQAHAQSDIDIWVEIDESIGFFEFFQIKHYLEDLLQCSIDLGTADALKEHLRKPVLEESIRVF